jgi:hypothetical protein
VPVTATSVAEALERLGDEGYTEMFRAEAGGFGVAGSGCVHEPEAFRVERIFRFEGVSDPDDETIVFGLRCERHGVRGTWAPSYGPQMDPIDAEMARRLGASGAEGAARSASRAKRRAQRGEAERSSERPKTR